MTNILSLLLSFIFYCGNFLGCVCASHAEMTLSPDHQVTVLEGNSLQVNCSVTDSEQAEKWQRPSWKAQGNVQGSPPQRMPSFNTVTLYFQRVHRSDAGFYKCSYNTSTTMLTKGLFIQVTHVNNGAKCESNQFTCKTTLNCISMIYRCDNRQDCIDGSDEINCKDSESCENKFICGNGKCIEKDLVCDKHHEDNCGDWSDEYCVLLLPSTAESKKDTANTTIDATIDKDEHMTWLKTTLYVVIGCTVSVVFFISVIVVAVFRIRMKRNTVRRNYSGGRSRRRQNDNDQFNYQAEDPFLNMAPSANYGNIIVNVNNGIQYVPGAEFSEITAIMEAPPSYSDVEREIFEVQNIPPPDYSTIDRNPLQVNNVIVTPSRAQNSHSGSGPPSSSIRDRSHVNDSRPRTQNAAVQTLTHRSHGGQRQSQQTSGSDSLPRQPILNVQGGQILLTNRSENEESNSPSLPVSEDETVTSQTQTERPSSALLHVEHGQITLSDPNINVTSSELVSTENSCQVVSENSQENPNRSGGGSIQVCEGQIVLANDASPVVFTSSVNNSAAINDSPSRRQLDVCEGQIVLK